MYGNHEETPHIYVNKPYHGRPAIWGNAAHIAFLAETRAEIDAFHRAAMDFEGPDEGAPGVREHYASDYYAA